MADLRTHRPDLEALEYARPSYLTDQIFPMLPRAMQQGTIYYQDLQSASSAQDGRTAGNAPTENTVADAKTTFNLENDELFDRQKIPDNQVSSLGGLDAAQQMAARRGKRSVGNAIEDITVANVLANGSLSYTDIGTSLVSAVSVGFDTLADLAGDGPIVLALSSRLFTLVKRYDEVVERMQFTGVLPQSVRDVRGISKAQLAATLGVDDVIVGNNEQWYTQSATYRDRSALIKLPAAGIDPIETPQVGRTIWFSPDGLEPAPEALFEIHSWYNKDKVSEIVDIRVYAEQSVYNVEHIYGLAGLDTALITS